jgi:flagellar biosynthesis GTPase FlhF
MSPKKQSAPSPKKTVAPKAPSRAVRAKAPAKRTKAKPGTPVKSRALTKLAREAAAQKLKESKRLERLQERERAEARAKADREERARQRVADRLEREAEKERKKKAAREERIAERELRRANKPVRPRTPRPGLPEIKKGRVLPEEEMRKDWTERPLTGRDLDTLCRRFGLNSSEFSAQLGLQNRFQFVNLIRTAEVVPFDVEILARLYEMSPSPAPWISYSADQAFQTLYGPALEEFSGSEEDLAYARTLFYARFTAALDRSSSTAYRWVEDEGKARLVIALILRKLMSMNEPLKTLEDLTRLVHKVRGGNFENRAPYPMQGARLYRRGRAAKLNRTANKQRGNELPIDIQPLVL